MKLGKRLRELRLQKGLTQKELASKAGLAPGTIQQYELGKRQPRIEQLEKLAFILDTTLSELVQDYTDEVSTGSFWDGIDKNDVISILDEKNIIWQKAGFSELNPPKNDDDRKKINQARYEYDLLSAFSQLNPYGKQEAIHLLHLLLKIPEYISPAD